jgi:amidase
VAEILDIKPYDWGLTLIIPGFGFLQDTIPGPYTKVFHLEVDGTFHYGEAISFGLKPMIGTIGVAPTKPITTLSSGMHGGNLDTTGIRKGSKVFLPVLVDGALLSVGDVHSITGDGEVCGTGIECGAEVIIKLDLMPNYQITKPRIETETELMCVASAEDLEHAIKLALQDMVDWMQGDKHLSAEEAFVRVNLVGSVRISQVVDPAVTVRVTIPKDVFIR